MGKDILDSRMSITIPLKRFQQGSVFHGTGIAYKGWIDVKWMEIENATRTTLTSVAGQAVDS